MYPSHPHSLPFLFSNTDPSPCRPFTIFLTATFPGTFSLPFSPSDFMHPFLVMSIDREKILESALNQIMAASDNDLTKPLRVIFINEEAIDEGGVRKEFFQLLVAQLFSLEYGKFIIYCRF